MSRIRKLWLAFCTSWGMYLYVWIQFAVILSIICVEINSLHFAYHSAYFVDDYEEGMYLYAEAMAHIRADQTETGVGPEEMIQKLSEIDGVKGVGYTLALWSYSVMEGEKFSGSNYFERDVEYPGAVLYMNDTMKGISYHMEDGVWLDDADAADDNIPVVVGSAVGNVYGVGEVLTIQNAVTGKYFDCEVVGVIHEYASTIALDEGGSSKTLPVDSYTPWQIFINDAKVLEGLTEEEYSYPSTCLMLELEEEFNETALREYGNIYPLKYMQGCSENDMWMFMNTIFERYGILIFVVLFGVFGSTYLIMSKSMYRSSVFLLLGMTRRQLASEYRIIYGVIYLSTLPVIYVMWKKFTPMIQTQEYWWTNWHMVFLLVMVVIVMMIVTFISGHMIRSTPKEMINIAKSMDS